MNFPPFGEFPPPPPRGAFPLERLRGFPSRPLPLSLPLSCRAPPRAPSSSPLPPPGAQFPPRSRPGFKRRRFLSRGRIFRRRRRCGRLVVYLGLAGERFGG
ncbi:hypothetical protein M758_7G120500 [Ceratodon purpureus]|nr:hypothetical protein M758_7G120500 [Ceratodon purpureus]